jgi:hypothetical protein
MWMGEVEEEPIQPFRRLESADSVELKIMEKLIQDLKLTTPEPLRKAGKETVSIDIPGAFEVIELLTQNKHLYEMPFFRISSTGGIELCEVWSKAVYSLENILRRTWWKRIWTVQEAFLPDQAQLHIGPHSYPYVRFVEGAKSWEAHVWSSNFILGGNSRCCLPIFGLWTGYISHEIKESVNRVRDLATLREIRLSMGDKSVAHHLFMLSIQRSATLAHDYVYGIFGLITEFFQIDENPDYSKDPTLLYARTTIKFMANAQHLCLLPYARPQHREIILTKETESLHQLPSWCPDWSADAWGDYFDIYNFGGFTADKLLTYNGAHQGETTLKLEGVAVDKIQVVGRLIGDMKTSPSEFVPIIQEWLDLMEGKGLSPQALWETIHVATHKDKGPKVVDLQAAWWELLKDFAKNGTSFQEMQDAAKSHLTLSAAEACNGLTNELYLPRSLIIHRPTKQQIWMGFPNTGLRFYEDPLVWLCRTFMKGMSSLS